MTKEELKLELYEFSGCDSVGEVILLEDILHRFFSQNVCIPKGLQPHPYADVLHAYAEGTEIESAFKGSQVWSRYERYDSMQYRIKPSEQVYEWQWLEDGKVQNLGFYIEDELEDYPNKVYQKIEETKRLRNA